MSADKKRPRDTNQLAKRIVDIATGEADDSLSEAQERARRAGKVGGKARAESLTADERSRIARKAALARWKDHASD